ncbi:MAG: phage tail spike protein [Lachnospiraceae bacterium]
MVLFPTKCELTQVLKGTWELQLEHPIDPDDRWKSIEENGVISAVTPQGKQLFRIDNRKKDDDSVTAVAYPIFFDSGDEIFMVDTRPTNKTGKDALDLMLGGSTKYSAESDITAANTAYYVRKNFMEALNGDDDNSFLNRWGGEPIYNNYKVIVNEKAGGDYGVRVLYGKNLEGAEEEIDYSEIVTRMVPTSFNGYMLDGDEPWVDSPLINSYPKIYYKTVHFEDVKLTADSEDEDEETFDTLEELQAELIRRCELEFENGADKPTVTLDISLVDIAKTEEYRDYEILETIGLGDTLYCKHRELGIETEARAVEIVWDCIEEKISSVVIGDYIEPALNSTFNAEHKVSEAIRSDGSVIAERVAGIMNAMDTQLRYQKDIAQRQDVRAILFEDLDDTSNTYGAMCLGTQGFQIASKRTTDGKDWDWTTAATANGIIADAILTGLIADKTGNSYWNLDTGDMQMRGKFDQYDSTTGYPSVRIHNNRVDFYDWEDSGNYVGSIGAVHETDTGRRGVNFYSDSDDMLRLGWNSQDGTSAPIKTILSYDPTNSTATPWIRNTASGTLLPNPGGGVVVENGLIKSWSLNTASGTLDLISGLSWSDGNITSVTRTAVTVVNGLITNWSSSTTNY